LTAMYYTCNGWIQCSIARIYIINARQTSLPPVNNDLFVLFLAIFYTALKKLPASTLKQTCSSTTHLFEGELPWVHSIIAYVCHWSRSWVPYVMCVHWSTVPLCHLAATEPIWLLVLNVLPRHRKRDYIIYTIPIELLSCM
jgi:hypothetical protein